MKPPYRSQLQYQVVIHLRKSECGAHVQAFAYKENSATSGAEPTSLDPQSQELKLFRLYIPYDFGTHINVK